MTAVTHGADPDALRRLAEDMLNHAEYTLGVGIRTQQQLIALHWSGPDADRTRAHWENVELRHIRDVTRALAEAAGAVLEHERAQREASEDATGASPSGTTPASTASPGSPRAPQRAADSASLLARARKVTDFLTAMPQLGQVAAVVAAGGRDALTMTRGQYAWVSSLIGASKPVVGGVLEAAGVVGTGLNVYDAVTGIADKDAARATGGIGGLITNVLGGPAIGASWGLGYATGGAIYEGIQGTSYGDAFEARNEVAFDTMGPFGMLIVPGNLALAGWDVLTGDDEGDDGPSGEGGR